MLVLKRNKNKIFLGSFIIGLLMFMLIFGFTYIIGHSMEGTMEEGDVILVNRVYDFDDIERGDIAILDINYKGKQTRIIKRIIGVAGDVVEFSNNELYINGEKKKEVYIKEDMDVEDGVFVVPEDKVFVLGDNRNISADSRDVGIGFINFDKAIYGKAILNLSKFSKL